MPSSGGDATEFMPPLPGKAGLDDWSSDGRFILYHDASTHMFVVELAGGHQTILVTDTVSGEQPDQGAFAPATNEVAFTTQETGRSEVYVKAFPPTGARRQISNAGGVQPLWRRDGRELYYLALDGTLMAVDILSPAPAFRAGVPRPLFKTRIVPAYQNFQYGASSDGSHFVLLEPALNEPGAALRIVLDWRALLETKN